MSKSMRTMTRRKGQNHHPRLVANLIMKNLLVVGLLAFAAAAHAGPTVTNVRAGQRAGTKLVDIYYDLADPSASVVSISVLVSEDAGATWTVPAYTFSGDYGGDVSTGVNKHAVWDAGADWNLQFTSQCRVRVIANDGTPGGFAFIPAGYFNMGDALDGESDAPVHAVFVSAFYMERTLVSFASWTPIYQWATANGYRFDNAGLAKASDHPVQTVNWFDAAKWCNARSQHHGLTPAYYTDAGLTALYTSGQAAPFVKWSANGYRLPTEAEWEKAARGGLSGQRFPWGNTITTNQANYHGNTTAYNLSGLFGYNPAYATGGSPFTSPVTAFPPNGYGLYDMAGNVLEWCWDWYGGNYYSSSTGTDPHGPANGSGRVLRGCAWYDGADFARCANRYNSAPPNADNNSGFRCVRGL